MNILTFLIGLPGASEWVFIILYSTLFILGPVMAFIFYRESQRLRKEIRELKELLNKDK